MSRFDLDNLSPKSDLIYERANIPSDDKRRRGRPGAPLGTIRVCLKNNRVKEQCGTKIISPETESESSGGGRHYLDNFFLPIG